MYLASKVLLTCLAVLAAVSGEGSVNDVCSYQCWEKPLTTLYEFGNDSQRRAIDFLRHVRDRTITYERGITYLLGYAR